MPYLVDTQCNIQITSSLRPSDMTSGFDLYIRNERNHEVPIWLNSTDVLVQPWRYRPGETAPVFYVPNLSEYSLCYCIPDTQKIMYKTKIHDNNAVRNHFRDIDHWYNRTQITSGPQMIGYQSKLYSDVNLYIDPIPQNCAHGVLDILNDDGTRTFVRDYFAPNYTHISLPIRLDENAQPILPRGLLSDLRVADGAKYYIQIRDVSGKIKYEYCRDLTQGFQIYDPVDSVHFAGRVIASTESPSIVPSSSFPTTYLYQLNLEDDTDYPWKTASRRWCTKQSVPDTTPTGIWYPFTDSTIGIPSMTGIYQGTLQMWVGAHLSVLRRAIFVGTINTDYVSGRANWSAE